MTPPLLGRFRNGTPPRPRKAGAYIIRSLDGRLSRVEPRVTPGYVRAVPTEADEALVRALLALRAAQRRLAGASDAKEPSA